MSNLFTTAGAKLYIGAAKTFSGTDFVESDFTSGSPSYTEVGGLTNLGTVGDTADLVSSNQIGNKRTRKRKGARNGGSIQITADIDYADAGQQAVIAAAAADVSYGFKLVFNDAPAAGTPSVRYFTALVMSAGEQLDDANHIMNLASTLEVDSNIVRVSASA